MQGRWKALYAVGGLGGEMGKHRYSPRYIHVRNQKRWFYGWRRAAAIQAKMQWLMEHLGSNELFNRSGLNFLFEAWVACEFASLSNHNDFIRIPKSDPPDFQFGTHPLRSFEVVEVQMKDRRRGLEYRKMSELKGDPVQEWARRVDAIPELVREMCERKSKKSYSKETELIVYLNPGGTYGLRQEETIQALFEATASARQTFADVWVLWDGMAIRPGSPPEVIRGKSRSSLIRVPASRRAASTAMRRAAYPQGIRRFMRWKKFSRGGSAG